MVSESVEMYLVMTALLRKADQPVPLSLLAEKLSISSVSANEMCRKLEERGLVHYQPYKGVTLTDQGEEDAQRVLRRRRLWVVFLVESLGIEPHEADEIACELEHITSDKLVESLARFLEHEVLSPNGQADPRARHQIEPMIETHPLTNLPAGEDGQVIAIQAKGPVKDFLYAQGVISGARVAVLATGANGSLVVNVANQQLSLARSVAEHIEVVPVPDSNHIQPTSRYTWEKCMNYWGCMRCIEEGQCELHTPFQKAIK
jgi:DtxR family Mn-dependent transcriptional regulator